MRTVLNASLEPENEYKKEKTPINRDFLLTTFLSKVTSYYGAGGRTRTGTVSLPMDFESITSTNSITPACIMEKSFAKAAEQLFACPFTITQPLA